METLTQIVKQQAEALLKLGSLAPPAATLTVRQLFARFEKAYSKRACWRKARARLEPFVANFGDDPAGSVTPPRWAVHRDERKDHVAAITVNFELDWAKRMYNWAMEPEQGLLAANPLALAKREKTRSARETFISEADVQALLAALAVLRSERAHVLMRAFLLNLVDAGLRFNEMRKFRRDRVRHRADGVAVGDVGRTKNGKAHLIAFTDRGWEALEAVPEVLGSPCYFANPNTRKLYNESTFRLWFRRMVVAAGLDEKVADGDVRLRCHDLRHSAATAADRRGASLSAVQQMLNHSSPAITVRYIHRGEENAVAIARLMSDGAAAERAQEAERKRKGPARAEPTGEHTVVGTRQKRQA